MNIQHQDGLVDLKGLLAALSLRSRSSYYKYAQRDDFPRGFRLGGNRGPLRFKARDVVAFIESLKADR